MGTVLFWGFKNGFSLKKLGTGDMGRRCIRVTEQCDVAQSVPHRTLLVAFSRLVFAAMTALEMLTRAPSSHGQGGGVGQLQLQQPMHCSSKEIHE